MVSRDVAILTSLGFTAADASDALQMAVSELPLPGQELRSRVECAVEWLFVHRPQTSLSASASPSSEGLRTPIAHRNQLAHEVPFSLPAESFREEPRRPPAGEWFEYERLRLYGALTESPGEVLEQLLSQILQPGLDGVQAIGLLSQLLPASHE